MQFKLYKSKITNKRTAPCTSLGSMTVEAALTIPLFLFAILCLVYLLEIHAIQTTVRMAAHTAAKEVAQQMAVVPELETYLFRNNLIRVAGADRLDRSIIVGGSSGIQCWRTQLQATDQLEVCVEYQVKVPFPFFQIPTVSCQETFRVKCWTGYQKGGSDSLEEGGNHIVYVTENGSVYHTDYECTHLQLSVQFVPADSVAGLRNESGGKYHTCDRCISVALQGGYYITDYGDKYHGSINCSGLKRTVYAVEKESVEGKGGCSKCTN